MYEFDDLKELKKVLPNIRYVPPQAFREDELQFLFWDSLLRACGIAVVDRDTIKYLH